MGFLAKIFGKRKKPSEVETKKRLADSGVSDKPFTPEKPCGKTETSSGVKDLEQISVRLRSESEAKHKEVRARLQAMNGH